MRQKHAHDLTVGRTDGFHQTDLSRLHHNECDECAGDAERCHEHDEEQNVEHHVFFHHHGLHHRAVLQPSGDSEIASECVFQFVSDAPGLIRITDGNGQPVDFIAVFHSEHHLRAFE